MNKLLIEDIPLAQDIPLATERRKAPAAHSAGLEEGNKGIHRCLRYVIAIGLVFWGLIIAYVPSVVPG